MYLLKVKMQLTWHHSVAVFFPEIAWDSIGRYGGGYIFHALHCTVGKTLVSSYRPIPMNWRQKGIGLFAVLLFLSVGRYYGLHQWLTPRLGRVSFLASGSVKRSRKEL